MDIGQRLKKQINGKKRESSETDPHKYSQLTFEETAKAIRLRKNDFSNKHLCPEKLDIHMHDEKKGKKSPNPDFAILKKLLKNGSQTYIK